MSEDLENVTIHREVSFAVVPEGDGRTIEARIVPYNQPTVVADAPEFGGTGVAYREEWLPGVFEKQARATHRVKLLMNVEHDQSILGVVGHAIALEDRPDALYGTFRVHPTAAGDTALHLVNEGIFTGLSIEAMPLKSRRTAAGVVQRLRAKLDKVALCRFPAYEDAAVLAVREEPESPEPDEPDPEPEPEPEPDEELVPAVRSEVDEILMRVGYEPVLVRAVVHKPWDGDAARFDDAEYERSCLLCRDGDAPPKTRCSLPVLEPNGDLNANALGAAAARLNQVQAAPAEKSAAARKLIRYYRQADMEPPERVRALASR